MNENDFNTYYKTTNNSPVDNDVQQSSAENTSPPPVERENSSYSYHYAKPKKKKSRVPVMALCGVLIIALSGGAGFFGGYYASNLSLEQAPTSSSTPEILTSSESTVTNIADANAINVASVASATQDSVVEISTEGVATDMFFTQAVTEGAGSGVVISEDGYIITNNHVIEDTNKITVKLTDGSEYEAVLIGTDSKTDIAVIKIEATGLQAATFGDSDSLIVGQEVVAIGNPLGNLGGTVTNGIISALDREISINNETMVLLQTNAAVNPGNSGGGLFDANGNLIGIVNAKSSGSEVEGLGFAVPSNTASEVAQSIIDNGYVVGRPYLGYSFLLIEDLQTAMQYRVNEAGLYVAQINIDDPVLKIADRILSIEGEEISTVDDIKAILEMYNPGDTLQAVIKREGEEMIVSLPVNEYAPETEIFES